MKTPDMKFNKDGWLKNNIPRFLYNNATIPTAAENLGIDRKVASESYMKTMIAASHRAIHDLYGKVRVFSNGHVFFLLHATEDKIVGYEKSGYSDWKCAPALDAIEKVPSWARKP